MQAELRCRFHGDKEATPSSRDDDELECKPNVMPRSGGVVTKLESSPGKKAVHITLDDSLDGEHIWQFHASGKLCLFLFVIAAEPTVKRQRSSKAADADQSMEGCLQFNISM